MAMMRTDLTAALRVLEEHMQPEDGLLCAVSGGLDSMCLLHLVHAMGLQVTAAHFNHQLRGEESDRDEAFVRDWCAANGVPFVRGGADVRAAAAETGETVEEAGRRLRYAFLEEQRQALGCAFVLTAHHADDHAETMLLNLIRGTGLKGLTGIPERRGSILRPLLAYTRAELAAYAEVCGIPHVEDSTNLDSDAAARNRLRLQVLPLLKELNPRAVEHMARTAALLAADEAALTHETERLLARCTREPGRFSLPVWELQAAEPAIRSRCVLAALAAVGGHRKDLTAAHTEAVCGLFAAPAGKSVSLPCGMTAVRNETAIVVERREQPPAQQAICPGETVRFGPWRVTLAEQEPGWALQLPRDAVLLVTGWDRADRMTVSGRERSLKRLCAERGISPAERDVLPVLRVDGLAAAVPGVGIHEALISREGTGCVFVKFEYDFEERI